MRFAHMADVHLGSWRDEKLKALSISCFQEAVSICLNNKLDFVLISGDLFHSAIPPIDIIKTAVRELKRLSIPVYIIAGSHDFSPSGKTMIDVLEEAELVKNVVRGKVNDQGELELEFTIDDKTGARITGMLGKKGMLEKRFYESLNTRKLEQERGFKIFMFHTAISELKPEELEKMESSPVSLLPRGFDYYAGGHVHIVKHADIEGYSNLVYPGPVFPANFAELEKLQQGGLFIYDSELNELQFCPIQKKKVVSFVVDADHKSPVQVMNELEELADSNIVDCIVLVRISGKLKGGRSTDISTIHVHSLFDKAFIVLVNKAQLTSEEMDEIKIDQHSAEDIETALIREHIGQVKVGFSDAEEEITKQLIRALSLEKQDGEKIADYQSKIKGMVKEIIRV